jgi:hypothetical protein
MNLTGPAIVYLLCMLTSVVCAWLLIRAWSQTKARLLFWAGLSFVLLAGNNVFLFLDLIALPSVPLLWARQLTQLAAISVLLYGFIWEADR